MQKNHHMKNLVNYTIKQKIYIIHTIHAYLKKLHVYKVKYFDRWKKIFLSIDKFSY